MKKMFIRFLSILLALQSFTAAQLLTVESAQASFVAPKIVINEVMWMGSYDGTTAQDNDEWIELYNPGATDVDVSGWYITNVITGIKYPENTDNRYTFPEDSIVAAGEYVLVGSNTADTILTRSPDYTESSFDLNDSCRQITLYAYITESSEPVDTMGCSGDDYFAGLNDNGNQIRKSMERNTVVADGDLSSSWQTSLQQVNIDGGDNNFASPWSPNDDLTAPVAGEVRDGTYPDPDSDISTDSTTFEANWDEFTDPESGIESYSFLLTPSNVCAADDLNAWNDVGLATSVSLVGLSLAEGVYYSCVQAVNRQGLQTTVSSDGVIVDTSGIVVTGFELNDPASLDNGETLVANWSSAAIADGKIDHFKIEVTADGGFTQSYTAPADQTTLEIIGLTPGVLYTAVIVAVDGAGNESISRQDSKEPSDNLPPTLNQELVVVGQNNPGVSDTITGLANASSEPATVVITDRNPVDPSAVVIASVATNGELGFETILVGDNLYAKLYVQLIDAADNKSAVSVFDNDIVGPNAPTLTSGKATCFSERCQIVLNWVDNGPDTAYYTVQYLSDSQPVTTAPIFGNSIVLNLPVDGSFQQFTVQAFDQYGNPSQLSNSFGAALVPGVITSGLFDGSTIAVTTEGLNGSRETISAAPTDDSARIVPSAQAADDEADVDTQTASSQDWLRILLAVIILLIIAAGFYSLSRSMQKSELDIPEKPTKKEPQKKATNGKKKKPRRRK